MGTSSQLAEAINAAITAKYGGSSPSQASSGGSSSAKATIAADQARGQKRTQQIKTGQAVAQMTKDQRDGYYKTLKMKGVISDSEKDSITGSANKGSGYKYGDVEKSWTDKALESMGILKGNSGSNIEMSNAAKSAWDTWQSAKAAYDTARTDGSDSATLRAARNAMDKAEQEYQTAKSNDKGNYYAELKYSDDFNSKAYEGQRDYGQIQAIDGTIRNTGNKINFAINNKDKILSPDVVSEGGDDGLEEYRNLWNVTYDEADI